MKWSRTLRRSSAWAVAAGAVLAALAPAGPAAAAGPVWQESLLPGEGVQVSGLATPGAGTTWAAATRAVQEGKGTRFEQALFTTDPTAPGGWREVALDPAGTASRANAVDADRSSGDALLVGDYDDSLGAVVTQHAHDGTWSPAPAPVPEHTLYGGLLQVDVRAPGDAWAVGWAQIDDGLVPGPDGGPSTQLSHHEPLVEHWDGTAWTRATLPAVTPGWTPADVEALAPDDVWAVGQSDDTLQPVLMHYDGAAWTRTPTPRYGGVQGELLQLAARDGAVWAVGSAKPAADADPAGLVLRLSGGVWRPVPLPHGTGRLIAAAATPAGVAAVGTGPAGSFGLLVTCTGTRDLHLPADVYVTSVLAQGSTLRAGGARPATATEPLRPVVLTAG